jgi:hypothetical protein
MRHLTAILATANAIGWPTETPSDLEVDRETCEGLDPSEPFLWILGANGTAFIVPNARRGGYASDQLVIRARRKFGGAPGFFWWDGVRLEELGCAEEACAVLADREATLRYLEVAKLRRSA